MCLTFEYCILHFPFCFCVVIIIDLPCLTYARLPLAVPFWFVYVQWLIMILLVSFGWNFQLFIAVVFREVIKSVCGYMHIAKAETIRLLMLIRVATLTYFIEPGITIERSIFNSIIYVKLFLVQHGIKNPAVRSTYHREINTGGRSSVQREICNSVVHANLTIVR